MENIYKKILNISAGAIIILFLLKILITNWQEIRNYKFSFNYFYLFLSYVLFVFNSIFIGAIWNVVLRFIDPEHKMSFSTAIKIVIYARLGKYLPGKVWSVAARVYFAQKEKISKKILFTSSLQQMIIGILSGVILGFSLIITSSNLISARLCYLLFITLPIIIILLKPNYFYPFINYLLRKFNKTEIKTEHFLRKRKDMLIIFLLTAFSQIIGSLGFICLIKSITPFSSISLKIIMGIYILAATSGFAAPFAPGGLGVKEGILAGLMQFYFPASMAILISLLSRIWLVAGEIFLVTVVFIWNKLKTIKSS